MGVVKMTNFMVQQPVDSILTLHFENMRLIYGRDYIFAVDYSLKNLYHGPIRNIVNNLVATYGEQKVKEFTLILKENFK